MVQAPVVGLLTWLVPGLGHIYLGHRGRGLILMIALAVTFWGGIAIGGVKETIDPQKHNLWFTAQICGGGHTLVAYALHRHVTADGPPADPGHWLGIDIALHYTGVAGLLNLLIIFDAIGRADTADASVRRKRGLAGGAP